MKKIGTTALVVLTALSLSALSVGCEKKADTSKPTNTNSSGTNTEKPKDTTGGGH